MNILKNVKSAAIATNNNLVATEIICSYFCMFFFKKATEVAEI